MDGIIHIKIHLIFIMVPWGGGGGIEQMRIPAQKTCERKKT